MYTKPKNSSFFNFAKQMYPKEFPETDTSMMSPTSILDTKPFTNFRTSIIWSDKNGNRNGNGNGNGNSPKNPEPERYKRLWDKLDTKKIGLGIVNALKDENFDPSSSKKPESPMVLFGSQLRVQIPVDSRTPQVGGVLSKQSSLPSELSGSEMSNPARVFAGSLSASERKLSEDYTCAISHGPNPRTTHIFQDYVVKSCCGVVRNGSLLDHCNYPSKSFLSFCYTCNKDLESRDIYMYRGEKAFCSSECRFKEIVLDEDVE